MRRRALLAAASAALLSGAALGATAKDADPLRPLVDLIETVRTHYVGDVQLHTKGLINEALKGMVSGLDRYSEYLDRQRDRFENKELVTSDVAETEDASTNLAALVMVSRVLMNLDETITKH